MFTVWLRTGARTNILINYPQILFYFILFYLPYSLVKVGLGIGRGLLNVDLETLLKSFKTKSIKTHLRKVHTYPGCSSGRSDSGCGRWPPPPLLRRLSVFEISTRNRFVPICKTVRDAVIIGDSIVRHVRATLAEGKLHTHSFPGARVLMFPRSWKAMRALDWSCCTRGWMTPSCGRRRSEIDYKTIQVFKGRL